MSKFFNETMRASQFARKQLTSDDVDLKDVIQRLKQDSASGPELAEVRLQRCRKAHLDRGNAAPLVLRQDDSAQVALEAYRGLRTRLMRIQSTSGFRSIAITSSAPREGKTLTVMNLGLCYSQLSNQRVLVIDADLRTQGLTQLLGQRGAPGLAEVLAGQANPDEAILATDQENFFALPAGTVSIPPPELLAGTRWQEFIGWCSETFKLVLVDTPPSFPLADFELINAACDGVLLVVRANLTPREQLQKTKAAVDSKKLLGIVLNGKEVNVKSYYGRG